MPATKRTARKLPDTYFDWIKELPLTHLQDEADLAAAQAMLDRLLGEALDEGGEAYLNALTDLVETYEAAHHPIPDASEADVLRHLMEANALNQAGLAEKVGIAASTVSSVLKGTRSLTKAQILALAAFFHVDPAVFLPRRM